LWRDSRPIFARNDNDSQPGDSTERVFRAQLVVTNRDGTSINILNLENWEATAGPVTVDSIYNGDVFDARLALPHGWDAATNLAGSDRSDGGSSGGSGSGSDSIDRETRATDSGRWVAAAEVTDAPRGKMAASAMPRIALDRVLSPVEITQPTPGLFVVDFGLNVAGWAVLKHIPAGGNPGQRIVIKYAEVLQHKQMPDLKNGSFNPKLPYFKNLRSANSTDVYILAGVPGKTESYTPSFTYHGGRYVQVTGLPGVLTADHIEFHHFHSANAPRAAVNFSSPTLNAIQTLAVGAQRSNMMSVPTDCDQRDERLGWMGDADLSVGTMLTNYDSGAFFGMFMANMASELDQDGSLPDVVPAERWASRPGDPSWTAAFVETAYQLLKIDGDRAVIARFWPQLQRHLSQLAAAAKADASSWPPTLYG
jgi:alpha-L-rhamnosidase